MKMQMELPITGTWLSDLGRASPLDRVTPMPLPFPDVGYWLNRLSLDPDNGVGVYEVEITESEFPDATARAFFEVRLTAFAAKSKNAKIQAIRVHPFLGPNAQATFAKRNSNSAERARVNEILTRGRR